MTATLSTIDEQEPYIVVAQEPEEEEEMQMGSDSGEGDADDAGGFSGRAEGEIEPPASEGGAAGGDSDGWHHGGDFWGDEGDWGSEEEYEGTGPQEGDKTGEWEDTEGYVGDGPHEGQKDGEWEETWVYEPTGPVGGGEHEVQEGECVSSIAKDTGHFWETIWDDPGNADLKQTRGDPNVLLPGDLVTIPELQPKEETGETEQLHRFRRKGEPAMLRLQLLQEAEEEEEEEQESTEDSQQAADGQSSDVDSYAGGDPTLEPEQGEDRPRANVPYTLIIDGEQHTGQTDDDGRIEVPIPGNARGGRLILNPGTDEEETIPLNLGHTSPISEICGVKERLANLGFPCGQTDDEETAELEAAVRAFQRKHGLEETGQADQTTRDRLRELHGC